MSNKIELKTFRKNGRLNEKKTNISKIISY